jgi:sporulation protein YabP
MERIDNSITNYNHEITLNERKTLLVSGVKKIENFDEDEFLMETTMGFLLVKGESLELIKLDTISGDVSIKGKINALDYIEDNKTKESQGIFNRLFK